MEKLNEIQIRKRIVKREKIKSVFMIAAFVAIVINAFYFYELYKFGGEKTFLLKSIEVFNILLSFGVYVLIIGYLRNNVTDVSRFLWLVDDFLLENKSWKSGRKSIMFMKHWRMYSSFEELSGDVDKLRQYNSKCSYWAVISVIVLLPVLLCNSVEVLFCGESARILMVWTDEVAFYIFSIPKCIFALILTFSLFMFLYYKDKIRTVINDSSKCKITATDVSGLIWCLLAIFIRLLVFY